MVSRTHQAPWWMGDLPEQRPEQRMISGEFGAMRWRVGRLVALVAVWGAGCGVVAQRVRVEAGTGVYFLAAGPVGMHGSQSYLGVDLREVESSRGMRGAEIARVDHDGPAGKAGLLEHDVVMNVNGQAIEGPEVLRRMLHETPPGRPLTLTVSRAGQQKTFTVQMGNREDVDREAWEQHIMVPDTEPAPVVQDERVERRGSGFLSAPGRAGRNFLGGIVLSPAYTGAMLETMAPQLAEYFGAQGKMGLLVRSVDVNSPAATAGLRAGDVVVRVNAISIATSSDWMRLMRENKGRAIPVVVLRERREQTLTIIPNAKHHSSLLPDFWPHRATAFWGGPGPDRASVATPQLPQ